MNAQNENKHENTLSIMAVVMLCVIAAAILYACITAKSTKTPPETSFFYETEESAEPASKPLEPIFILKTSGERLALFDASGEELIETYNIIIRFLPAADRVTLTNGIVIYSHEELDLLLAELGQ